MALSLTYPTLSAVYSSTEVQTNFTNVSAKFGNIKDSDIASTANISLSKLAGSKQEIWLRMTYDFTIHGGGAAWPADSNGATPLVIVGIPGTVGDTAWTATDIAWVAKSTGTTSAALFDLRCGYFNAGTWTADSGATIIVADSPLTLSAADNQPIQGSVEGLSVSIGLAADLRCIGLFSAGAGNGDCLNQAADYLEVTIALSRVIFA